MEDAASARVLVIGAGGHARVCLDALQDMGSVEIVGALSRDGSGIAGLGIPVLGTDADLETVTQRESITALCVAIGDNSHRRDRSVDGVAVGLGLQTVLSASATVSPSASIGAGAQLLPGAVVNAATSIGTGVIVNTNASVDHDCVVGEWVHIAPGVAIGGDVRIGAGTLVGIGACVLPGVTIGADVVVGAGAVVIRDVPDGAVVAGNPARPLGGSS